MQSPPETPANSAVPQPRLTRVPTLWDLIFYGIVLIQPVAPIPLFGVVQVLSHGYIVDNSSLDVRHESGDYPPVLSCRAAGPKWAVRY